MVTYRLVTGDVPGSNPGKGENFSMKITNWFNSYIPCILLFVWYSSVSIFAIGKYYQPIQWKKCPRQGLNWDLSTHKGYEVIALTIMLALLFLTITVMFQVKLALFKSLLSFYNFFKFSCCQTFWGNFFGSHTKSLDTSDQDKRACPIPKNWK